MSDEKDNETPGPSCQFSFRKPLRRKPQFSRKREEKPASDSCKLIYIYLPSFKAMID